MKRNLIIECESVWYIRDLLSDYKFTSSVELMNIDMITKLENNKATPVFITSGRLTRVILIFENTNDIILFRLKFDGTIVGEI